MRTAAYADKDRVLSFMNKFEPVAVAAGYVRDEVSGEYVVGVADLAYEHGGWEWYQRDAYHFEKYGLELDPEFIKLAIS